MAFNKNYNNYSRNSSNSRNSGNDICNINNNNQKDAMSNQRTPFRSTKRPWATSKETQQTSSCMILSRPDMIKRSTSLPAKLENAPRTKKLFWFRPTIYLPEKENRLDSPVLVQSFPRVESRDIPLFPTFEDENETKYNMLEELDDLVGLGFLNE